LDGRAVSQLERVAEQDEAIDRLKGREQRVGDAVSA
jgi:hypothetical protein